MTRSTKRRRDLPAITHDPTGELHGLPTYYWRRAPDGLLTRRQLSAKGLRPGGHPPVAMTRKGWLIAYLYDERKAKPKFRLTAAKLAAVWTAARSRYRCCECERTDLRYIPQQGEPAFGRCYTCMGLPEPDPEPPEMTCPGCEGSTEVACPACNGTGGWEGGCGVCEGGQVIACPMCQGL